MKSIRITKENITNWMKYEKPLQDGKIRFDSKGRLRYSHVAPVGDLLQTGQDKNGQSIYQELAEEWFDAGSAKANEFIWT